jgi:hypothetical protein
VAKPKIVCPFSRKACIECGIFRGRHSGLCYFPEYQERVMNKEELVLGGRKAERPVWVDGNTRFEFPELPENPKWLANLEDCTERRDG